MSFLFLNLRHTCRYTEGHAGPSLQVLFYLQAVACKFYKNLRFLFYFCTAKVLVENRRTIFFNFICKLGTPYGRFLILRFLPSPNQPSRNNPRLFLPLKIPCTARPMCRASPACFRRICKYTAGVLFLFPQKLRIHGRSFCDSFRDSFCDSFCDSFVNNAPNNAPNNSPNNFVTAL